ncbi:AEC family transporter [Candidatus Thorarchaeota archaeon]|nr:MAG: AEC family transporter [Candidatus Thorarchaeota archaeon]
MQTLYDLAFQMLVFYGLILLGYLITRSTERGEWLNQNLNSLLINVLVPVLVVYTLLTASPGSASELPTIIFLAVLVQVLGPALMYLRLRRGDYDPPTKGVYYLCVTFNNALFIPLPIALLFLGSQAVSVVIVFSLTQMLLFVTLGSLMGAAFSEHEASWNDVTRQALKFPPFLAAVVAILLFSLSLTLPEIITTPVSYVGPITTYLALISVGLNLGIRFTVVDVRSALNVVGIRQFLVPLLMLPIIMVSGLSSIPASIVLLEALMPPAVLTVVYAASFGLDAERAATIVTIGTLLLLPLLPLLPLFLG